MRRFIKALQLWLVPIGAPLVLLGVYRTVRWIQNDLKDRKKLPLDKPVIGAFWHGRQLMMGPLFFHSNLPVKVAMLVSSHSDGQMIAKAVKFFGIQSIAGSSSQGGTRAFRGLVQAMSHGMCTGVTPDGPRGPAKRCKDGVLKLAQITGAPIVPIGVGTNAMWRFRSWDSMVLPKPFSRGRCIVGEFLTVPRDIQDGEFESLRSELERRLSELDEEAERDA